MLSSPFLSGVESIVARSPSVPPPYDLMVGVAQCRDMESLLVRHVGVVVSGILVEVLTCH